jgi:hypothetical protein
VLKNTGMNKLVNPQEENNMRGNKASTKTVSGSLSSVKDATYSNTSKNGNKGDWKQ